MKVAFRVDASIQIGTGHLVRCLTLAEQLREKGAEIYFLCRNLQGFDPNTVTQLEHNLHLLETPSELGQKNIEPQSPPHASWLPCIQEADARDCKKIMEGISPLEWLVVDHYALDKQWEELLRPYTKQLFVIDDLADRPHECDVLLDQNYFPEGEKRYKHLVPEDCRILSGPRYALLRKEYHETRWLIGPRRGPVSRIMVFYGGIDRFNETGRALRVLSSKEFQHIAVDVVLGHQHPNQQELARIAGKRPETDLHGPKKHLAGLMAEADLALGAGGTTTWERCATGLPSIVTALAANQEPFCQTLAEDNRIHYLGRFDKITDSDLLSALLDYLNDSSRLQELAWRAWEVTDALGTQRISEVMAPTPMHCFSLQPTYEQETNTQFPAPHQNAATDNTMLIMVTPEGLPVGQIWVDSENDESVLYYTVDRTFNKQKLESCLLELAADVFRTKQQFYLPEKHRGAFFKLGSIDENDRSQKGDRLSITILSDPDSWFNNWIKNLLADWLRNGYRVRWIHRPDQLKKGDLCFLLSCGHLVTKEHLSLHKHNIVVHGSNLPKGRGWSPMTWLVLEGATRIPITLIEAVEQVDAGDIYLQEWIDLKGYELIDQLREKQGQGIINLCKRFVSNYPSILTNVRPQEGTPSWYPRRKPEDSEIDINKTIKEQFNLLRVVDNEAYPAFFRLDGYKYFLKIFRTPEQKQ